MARATPRPSPLADGPAIRAEFVFLAIMTAMALLLLLSGVPGGPERVAGGGSEALRHGWADARRLPGEETSAGEPPAGAHLDPQGLPTGRGRTPADARDG